MIDKIWNPQGFLIFSRENLENFGNSGKLGAIQKWYFFDCLIYLFIYLFIYLSFFNVGTFSSITLVININLNYISSYFVNRLTT